MNFFLYLNRVESLTSPGDSSCGQGSSWPATPPLTASQGSDHLTADASGLLEENLTWRTAHQTAISKS